ncbi:Homeodomain-like DNA binding domain-containing transcription factor [Phycomyces blakesleeanus NRRL 1555(-)]|uniref:Homeodomain-like DNA binding domain-containing transcription factor n=2 Tax=Phycomyces blakesleeanus TaxID=4837 RepID=A0A162TQZ7_PHYB8|nr:Homeodomain-like DNA binding domain-containing transcription factor [Phycomyces blakesleeanus NRRL 1555(-)]OAD69103.1 Homeodomain-like DNA binding domain-containing transcription factor [Phycomyces blakesleeanus NRRL 1555(-)]|eukprot:XP_018287143.1 Homeodomain-like DNA binding domain-containing transcription factor [Phycomyces blakesleeanus NRRL 1555(-)]
MTSFENERSEDGPWNGLEIEQSRSTTTRWPCFSLETGNKPIEAEAIQGLLQLQNPVLLSNYTHPPLIRPQPQHRPPSWHMPSQKSQNISSSSSDQEPSQPSYSLDRSLSLPHLTLPRPISYLSDCNRPMPLVVVTDPSAETLIATDTNEGHMEKPEGSDDTEDTDDEMSKSKRQSHPSSQRNSTGLLKPRWKDAERLRLFQAIVKDKLLDDMASFHWDKIAVEVGRPKKACKDQWRRELLPNFMARMQASYQPEQGDDQDDE